jgi:hypothetical protein
MAIREHQGYQIALAILTTLVVVLVVATFMFARKLGEEREKSAQFRADAQKANDEKTQVNTVLAAVMPIVGRDPADAADKITQEFANFKKQYVELGTVATAAKAPEGEPAAKPVVVDNYPALVEQLFKGIVFRDGVTADLTIQKDKLKKDFDASVAKLDTEKKAAEKAQEKAQTEREKVQKDTAEQIAANNKAKEDISAQLAKKGEEFNAAETQFKTTESKVRTQLERTKGNLNQVTSELARTRQQKHEVPDGNVTWVSASERVVYVNLGRADFLRPQISFSVYPADVTDVVTSKVKAKIEVTRVLGAHEAECRIVEDSVTDPILPKDKVYSPVWHPGRQIHFAITGKTDIDGDGNSDREKVRDLIRINGGVIDAEVTDDGKLIGEITVNTRYIIIGDRPTETAKTGVVEKHSQLSFKAKDLGVAEMNLQQFLDMMGFKSDERTVNLGRGADPHDFRAKDTTGATKRKGAEPFRERRPPAKEKKT